VLSFSYNQYLALIQSAQSSYPRYRPLGHTVTAPNNAWFTLLTQNYRAIHRDRRYAEQTEVGQDVLGDVSDALPCHQGQREPRVDQRPAKLD
jgi:hypothetical protein